MPPADSLVLQVPFRGARDYLQSADIFDALWQHSIGVATITFKHPIHTSHIRLLDAALPDAPAAAIADTATGSGTKPFHVYETESGADGARITDSADRAAAEAARVDRDHRRATLVLSGARDFSNAAAAVALVKALHQQVFPETGKWLVGCMKYHGSFYDAYESMIMHAEIRQVIGAGKLTETRVMGDDSPLFTIYFTPRP